MSTEKQLAGLPEDSLPASSQMEGIRIGGAWRLGFLLLCQENNPLAIDLGFSMVFTFTNWYSRILMFSYIPFDLFCTFKPTLHF